jgi:hypothetical protein
VNAEPERSGAVLLPEGIEPEEQRDVTRAPGAATSASRPTPRPVGALGCGVAAEPGPGRPRRIARPYDRLRASGPSSSIAPHFAAAFVARDLGDGHDGDMARRFDFSLTDDRELAVEAARGLLARIAPH